jgi:hypothetical protein
VQVSYHFAPFKCIFLCLDKSRIDTNEPDQATTMPATTTQATTTQATTTQATTTQATTTQATTTQAITTQATTTLATQHPYEQFIAAQQGREAAWTNNAQSM